MTHTALAPRPASVPWLALAGVLVGFGFLTKMLQAFLVVLALALAYLVAAPVGLWRRVRGLLLAGLAMLVAAGWWVAIVSLVPRPCARTSAGRRATACWS